MLRIILGIIVGVVAWCVVAVALGTGLRYGWADYAAVEKAMAFTVPMMAARLSISAIASLISGYVAALISKERMWAPLLAGLVLLAVFGPYHLEIWAKFPPWYHLTFLTSLPVLSIIGGRLRRQQSLRPAR